MELDRLRARLLLASGRVVLAELSGAPAAQLDRLTRARDRLADRVDRLDAEEAKRTRARRRRHRFDAQQNEVKDVVVEDVVVERPADPVSEDPVTLTVDRASMELIADRLANPREPTPELRALMRPEVPDPDPAP